MELTSLLEPTLPLTLMLITFSLGLGLTGADFRRVATAPRGFLAGLLVQVLLLPLVALGLVLGFGLEGELALGVMILSVCPGGVTSNVLTRVARGSVALSVTLTGVISLTAIVTAPVLIGLWMRMFFGADAPPIDIAALIAAMLALTGVPITAGMVLRAAAPPLAMRLERWALRVGVAGFAAILAATAAGNHALLLSSVAEAGPILLALAGAMLGLGWVLALAWVRDRRERIAVSIEAAIQNGPVGVTVGTLIESSGGLSGVAMPSGLYAVAMYAVAAPVILIARRRP